ncbi:MAG TPA: menaquinone biosynthesis protein [Vicinamibacterales bacterium]|nr:menaquinone biosynthesis protein [Vicinamibacterales bacterium]
MIRLGAVGYLNARPLVYGLERVPRFDIRYDIPAECARLLHGRETDVGLIPSIEYLRGPKPYAIVPGAGVTSKGPVASVAVYTRRDPHDIRTIAVDSSSRTSVALATVLLQRQFGITPEAVSMAPELDQMLACADAALIIGDVALFLGDGASGAAKLDLGEIWTQSTGLPFVYAVWTGWPDAATPDDVAALQHARDEGVAHADAVAQAYYPDDRDRQTIAARYLRDNIRYRVGDEELEGLRTFFRYAAELNLASFDGTLRFFR